MTGLLDGVARDGRLGELPTNPSPQLAPSLLRRLDAPHPPGRDAPRPD
jgi:hypothetical protein